MASPSWPIRRNPRVDDKHLANNGDLILRCLCDLSVYMSKVRSAAALNDSTIVQGEVPVAHGRMYSGNGYVCG